MQFVNLTPHTINLVLHDGSSWTLEPSGDVARVSEHRDPGVNYTVGDSWIRVVHIKAGDVTGLPEETWGTCYIVSGQVRAAVHGRNDVFSPDTGAGAVRNTAGQVIGTNALIAAV